MAISVKLEAFEGPLDLLLHLIEKNKIDIYDIPIVEITAQYLDYIRQMQREDMNVMSEFLVMAATLIDIKCKMLLPKEVNEDGRGRGSQSGAGTEAVGIQDVQIYVLRTQRPAGGCCQKYVQRTETSEGSGSLQTAHRLRRADRRYELEQAS